MLAALVLGASCAAPPEATARPQLTDALVMRAVLVDHLGRKTVEPTTWVSDLDMAADTYFQRDFGGLRKWARIAWPVFGSGDYWRRPQRDGDEAEIRALAHVPHRAVSEAQFAAAVIEAVVGQDRLGVWSGDFAYSQWRQSGESLLRMTAPLISPDGWALIIVTYWTPPRWSGTALQLVGWDAEAESYVVWAVELLSLT